MNRRITTSIALGSAAILLAATLPMALRPSDEPVSALPFYLDRDLTPNWLTAEQASGPGIHTVGDFSLVDQAGTPMRASDLAGRVYVASFFFVRCTAVCPTLRSNLGLIQEAFLDDDRVRLVSHTVDPVADSVSVLGAYARLNGVVDGKWYLATGTPEDIVRLAREVYFVDPDGLASGYVHTENVALVDGQGRIRGVYNGTLQTEMIHLADDIRTLLAEGGEA